MIMIIIDADPDSVSWSTQSYRTKQLFLSLCWKKKCKQWIAHVSLILVENEMNLFAEWHECRDRCSLQMSDRYIFAFVSDPCWRASVLCNLYAACFCCALGLRMHDVIAIRHPCLVQHRAPHAASLSVEKQLMGYSNATEVQTWI